MSRSFLTQLEQVDYDIGPIYVNPNYTHDITDLLSKANLYLSPPEINIMTPNKTYPKAIVESGKINRYLNSKNEILEPVLNRVMNIDDNTIKHSLLDLINSSENIKESFKSDYKKNNINYNKIFNYFYKK